MISRYAWSGGVEQMLWVGREAPVQIILIQPLFEEANRLRKTLCDVMRGLHANGFGVGLPDLPGTGESESLIHNGTFDDWHAALRSLIASHRNAGHSVILASFRGGALVDAAAETDGVWRLSQETGARLLRDISRTVLARNASVRRDNIFDHAGYHLPDGFVSAIESAIPQPANMLRTVRLTQDPNDADARIVGAPLWRRTEPGEDPALVQAIIEDISFWATQCAKH